MVTIWLIIAPSLPSVESLKDLRLQVPLRIYSADDRLMAEIGEQRRLPVALDDTPKMLRQAFLAAEDDRFYAHPGIDWRGTLRAVYLYARSMGQGRVPGGSTITQQVARRFFLSTDYSVTRKLREMMLALKIERELSKDEIFELYLNKEFLGHRAYGVGSAAQVYYAKTVDELSLAEAAMIAALPKAPSRDNPISGPERAMARRNWILDRMLGLGYIGAEAHAEARSAPNTASYHGPVIELDSPWVSEMVRQDVIVQLGAEEAYSGGYRAYTTIDSRMQQAANRAVTAGLVDYDRRHGWRGPEETVATDLLDDIEALDERLESRSPIAGMRPAVVLAAGEQRAELRVRGGATVSLDLAAVAWARAFLDIDAVDARPEAVDEVLTPGDLVRVRRTEDGWELAQLPRAEAALVSLEADNGAIRALVGGLDFDHSQYNRATQSRRQPGSAFKPFIYSAALDNGFTPASIINDAPVVIDDPSMERVWKPTNFSRRFFGPTRLREAMAQSRNLVSVRLLMSMGLETTRDYIDDFGFARDRLPNGPSMALGSASLTPLNVAAAYATFANGGYRIEPFHLHALIDADGHIVMEPRERRVCRDCGEISPPPEPEDDRDQPLRPILLRPAPGGDALLADGLEMPVHGPPRPEHAPRILDEQTAWLIDSMLGDVITRGTGRRALALERADVAGKTGTTNDQRDTWFAGYAGGLVTAAWLGRDDNESLGGQEQGGRTALPVWVDFMATALEERPETARPMPVGLTQALINPETGLRVRPGTPGAITEWFHADNLPPLEDDDQDRDSADPYDIY